jgi:5-formyltetrahydrofolate cyclo-ligase
MWLRTSFLFLPCFPIAGAMSISQTKADLRRQALERRASISEEVREAFAQRIVREGIELCRRSFVQDIATFWPIGSEPDTRMLMMALGYHQLHNCLPVTGPRGEALTFRRYAYGEPLCEGPMGTYEPVPHAPSAVPDFTFVPLAAFDRRGFRIGYGGGYYDATLAHLRATNPGPAVGIAFSCQEIDAVPDEPHDQPLDLILTERELIDCSLAWR